MQIIKISSFKRSTCCNFYNFNEAFVKGVIRCHVDFLVITLGKVAAVRTESLFFISAVEYMKERVEKRGEEEERIG